MNPMNTSNAVAVTNVKCQLNLWNGAGYAMTDKPFDVVVDVAARTVAITVAGVTSVLASAGVRRIDGKQTYVRAATGAHWVGHSVLDKIVATARKASKAGATTVEWK
jgi:hypothetical protein